MRHQHQGDITIHARFATVSLVKGRESGQMISFVNEIYSEGFHLHELVISFNTWNQKEDLSSQTKINYTLMCFKLRKHILKWHRCARQMSSNTSSNTPLYLNTFWSVLNKTLFSTHQCWN